MDRLFVETAGNRRRFLDRLVLALDPRHAQHGNRYEAALRARGKLLADQPGPDPQWLASLEAQLADHGAAIDAARQQALAALSAELATQPEAPFARPLLQHSSEQHRVGKTMVRSVSTLWFTYRTK